MIRRMVEKSSTTRILMPACAVTLASTLALRRNLDAASATIGTVSVLLERPGRQMQLLRLIAGSQNGAAACRSVALRPQLCRGRPGHGAIPGIQNVIEVPSSNGAGQP